jgi:hypothetical protein
VGAAEADAPRVPSRRKVVAKVAASFFGSDEISMNFLPKLWAKTNFLLRNPICGLP